jgi:hypothetical protein
MARAYDAHPDAWARIHQLTQLLSSSTRHTEMDAEPAGGGAAALVAIEDDRLGASRARAIAPQTPGEA